MNNEPVAWGYISADGGIYDCISPKEHARAEGDYTIPLYTHPAKTLTDEEILKMAADKFHYSEYKLVIEFARAILRKAQEK
jgi:hypothetical protein